LALGDGTYCTVHDLAVLEHEQSRDAADAILHADGGVVVHVQLADNGLAFLLFAEFLHHGTYHPAGSAPFGPKVDQHGLVALQDEFFEIAICEFECHGLVALTRWLVAS